MFKRLFSITALSACFVGCATVPTEPVQVTDAMKEFKTPSSIDNAGLYIYRTASLLGAALKKDIWVDDKCVGESARGTFFYEEVSGGTEHKVSTESEFSPNDLIVETQAGKNYFIKQYIKPGVFVGGAGLKLVTEEEGKRDISDLKLGVKGNCSK